MLLVNHRQSSILDKWRQLSQAYLTKPCALYLDPRYAPTPSRAVYLPGTSLADDLAWRPIDDALMSGLGKNCILQPRAMSVFAFAVLCSFTLATSVLPRQSSSYSPCRFSPLYSQNDILQNSSAFLWDVFYWEGRFHQNNVGYNTANGMTYDGTLLNPHTGLANASEKHPFSAPSKEVSSDSSHEVSYTY